MLYDVSVSNLFNVLKPGLDMKGSDSYSPRMLFPLERVRNGLLFFFCSLHGEHWCHDSHAWTCPYKVHSSLLCMNPCNLTDGWLELSSSDAVPLPVSLQGFAWTRDKREYVCHAHRSQRHQRNEDTTHYIHRCGICSTWICFQWGCMRYLSIVSVLPTVDGGHHTLSIEKQREVPAQKNPFYTEIARNCSNQDPSLYRLCIFTLNQAAPR